MRFGTVYERLQKIGICGDHDVLITGLGPVGMATAAVCRKMGAQRIIGIDVVPERLELARKLRLYDSVLTAGPSNVSEVLDLTSGRGVERAVDCSANDAARAAAIRATRKWGRIVFWVKEDASSSIHRPISSMTRRQSTARGSLPRG